MTTYNLSVDAELLRELGERLVGRADIALAELIKNAYDADASRVLIEFKDDVIIVTDNGHGMSETEFVARWMRVGTTRKRDEQVSPRRHRVLTGSKGVGRLAAQLLGRQIEITSTALSDKTNGNGRLLPAITAKIDWNDAVRAGDLTSVKVDVKRPTATPKYAEKSPYGTSVRISNLSESWNAQRFRMLAQQIWALQPPGEDSDFRVTLKTPYKSVSKAFDDQMRAILDIWVAKIEGRLLPVDTPEDPSATPLPKKLDSEEENQDLAETTGPAATSPATPDNRGIQSGNADVASRAEVLLSSLPTRYLEVKIHIRDGSTRTVRWRIDECEIDSMSFSVRAFEFRYRQPKGVRVGVAREYMSKYGGISVFDNEFRLPYYGAEHDWLRVAHDFASRVVASKLVPKELAVSRGLLQLPRNEQLFGRVEVSTSHEAKLRRDKGFADIPGLSLQVTRDRLVDNAAYQQLRVMARAALDLYAMEQAREELRKATEVQHEHSSTLEDPHRNVTHLLSVLEDVKPEIPAPTYEILEVAVREVETRNKQRDRSVRAYSAILGALATAGMTSLAYEHEMSKQVTTISAIARKLGRVAPKLPTDTRSVVESASKEMTDWAVRARRIRQVFKPLITRENRERVQRLRARDTILAVASQAEALTEGVQIDAAEVPETLLLPAATYPAWSSIIQNILVNSYNAMLDEPKPKLHIVGGGTLTSGWIEFQDNGVGVDLETADELWDPFERRLVLPAALEDAGLGGMGLGLTIIRMVSDEIGVRTRFVAPPTGFTTSLRIDWTGA